MENKKLVSVVMPTYNCGEYIADAIDSIIAQTYTNWNLFVVDDGSTDSTDSVMDKYAAYKNITYHKFSENKGSAAARNKGIEMADGEYIAFLDSDDKWNADKLSKQIAFMEKNNYDFTCTKVIRCDMDWNVLKADIPVYDVYDYNKILRRCPSNITIVYNAKNMGKYYVPDIKKRTDYVLLLKMIKDAKYLYALKEPLSSYRVRSGSISSKKTELIKYHWFIYRKIEKLNIFKSAFTILFIFYRKFIDFIE